MKKLIKREPLWLGTSLGALLAAIVFFVVPEIYARNYVKADPEDLKVKTETTSPAENAEKAITISHIETPKPLKAVYMTSWVAGTNSMREKVFNVIDKTELNAVVIDIKDYTGRIAFLVTDPYLQKIGSSEDRISDIQNVIDELHKKNIYVIGRISVFQDPFLVKSRPDLAVKKSSDKKIIWRDKKGISWLDAGSKEVWDYTVAISKEAYAIGFDELNFDYIRFPSDGNMKDIYFPISNDKIKKDVMKEFYKYLKEHLSGTVPKISADVFGMVATNDDDLGIGQILEDVAEYFDYVSPMVYPSHFPNEWNGFKNPAEKPYEVVKISMDKAVERMKVIGKDINKIRPWLQDFNLGAKYTKELVRAQIKATYDASLDSWMLWDPGNTYTEEALLPN